MAPQNNGSSGKKGKGIKKLAGKFPSGSAQPVVRPKRKVVCSKCKAPHFPPTGRACQKLESAPIPDLSAPHTDLSSTLAHTVEQLPGTSPPTLSPVRRDPETQAALDMLNQQAYLIASSSPTQAQESAPVTSDLNLPANQAQLINNLLQRFGQNTRSAPVVTSPVGQSQPIQPPPPALTYLVLAPRPLQFTHLDPHTIQIARSRTH